MKIMKIMFALLLSFVLFCSGCLTTSHRFNYPSSISGMCYGERNSAKTCIESIDGSPLKINSSLTLLLHNGERKIGGWWCFIIPDYPGMYIGGFFRSPNHIEVGCNPNTMNEVVPEVVKHEHGHYWLYTNNRENGDPHNPRYRNCFVNWYNPRTIEYPRGSDINYIKNSVRKEYSELESGSVLSVTYYDEKGIRMHIDFIVE